PGTGGGGMIGPRSFGISVGLEQAEDGTTVAHALSLPGCSAPGASPELALAGLEITLREWLSFLTATGERVPPESTELELSVDEWIATGTGTALEPGEVCFAHD